MAENHDYEKVLNYVENALVDGTLKVGDCLTTERGLSARLEISRGSVRMGLAVLEAIGIIDNRQGSGNYVNATFDHKLAKVMTIIYMIDGVSGRTLNGVRYATELEALMLLPKNIGAERARLLESYLNIMETSDDEMEQTRSDKMIHQLIVEACGNRLVIANYHAMNKLLDVFIRDVRRRARQQSDDDYARFQAVHRKLVEAVIAGDFVRAKGALDDHLEFLLLDTDT